VFPPGLDSPKELYFNKNGGRAGGLLPTGGKRHRPTEKTATRYSFRYNVVFRCFVSRAK
jgi:hypothetical protein